MYIYNKIKTKNNFGLSARTLVCYDSKTNILFIEVTMIVPIESKNHRFKTIRKLKHHKVVYNYLIFKLDTSIQIANSLNSIFNQIIKINPNNTINIKPIKDSWNRTEVVELLIKAMIYANQYHSDELGEDHINDWIEENL